MTTATARQFRQGDEILVEGLPATIISQPSHGRVYRNQEMQDIVVFNVQNILGEVMEVDSTEIE